MADLRVLSTMFNPAFHLTILYHRDAWFRLSIDESFL